MSEVTYKKVVDVEQIDTLGESTTLFVNDGGSMKQMGAAALGAVKSVNGVTPDENGDVEVNAAEKIAFVYMPEMGDLLCEKTAAEIHELYSNVTTAHGLCFILRVYDFTNPMAPTPDYLYNKIEVESIQNGGTYYKLIYHIHFGDVVPPVLVDAINNTITLDPDWVAPEADPEPTGAHQMLVTGADGSTKWEDKLAWKENQRIYLILEQTSVGANNAGPGGTPGVMFNLNEDLFNGQLPPIDENSQFKVCLNGTTYVATMDGSAYMFDDGNYSYAIMQANDAQMGLFEMNGNIVVGEQYTLSMYTEAEVIKPIDPEMMLGFSPAGTEEEQDHVMTFRDGKFTLNELYILLPNLLIQGNNNDFEGPFYNELRMYIQKGYYPTLNLTGASGLPKLTCQAFVERYSDGIELCFVNPYADGEIYRLLAAPDNTYTRILE